MGISIPNSTGYQRQSTGQKEESEAIRKSLNTYEDLAIKVLSGGPLNARTFTTGYGSWPEDFPKMGTRKPVRYVTDRISGIVSYPLTYFGSKQLDSLTKGDFIDS